MVKTASVTVASKLAELRSKSKVGIRIGSLSEFMDKVEVFETGNIVLDSITGIGGIPRGRIIEFFGPTGCGKALDLDSPVLTPDRGFVRMGDIALGDRVVDPHGEDSKVVGVYPQGILPVYRLNFSDGSWAEASGDHLWEVQDYVRPRIPLPSRRGGACSDCANPNIRARGLCISCYTSRSKSGTLPPTLGARTSLYGNRGNGRYVTKILTTDQLRTRMHAKRVNIQVPLLKPFDFDEASLPIDPYLLGLLLGDGNLSGGSVRLTIGDQDSLESIARIVPLLPQGVSIKKIGSSSIDYGLTLDGSLSGKVNPILSSIRSLELDVHSWDKFIPDIYKYASFESRLAILQGLMDSDGNWKRAAAEFSSSSKRLRDDVVEIARSLGLVVRLQKDKPTWYTKDGVRIPCRTAYRCSITESSDIRVFRLRRKLRPIHTRQHGQRKIISIEYVGDRECQCIKVSASSELFVTKDYIPTHNTTSALQIAGIHQKKVKEGTETGAVLYLDFERSLDMKYCRSLGIDPYDEETFIYMQPNSFEHGIDTFRALLDEGLVALCITDSVASMVSEKELEGDSSLITVGAKAKALNLACRQMIPGLSNNRASIIFLNHQQEKIDTSFTGKQLAARGIKQWVTPGGTAIPYYSSMRIQFGQASTNKTEEKNEINAVEKRVTSTDVTATVIKNKLSSPFRMGSMRVRFGKGFSQPYSVYSILVERNIIKKKTGGHYDFAESMMPSDGVVPVGEENVIRKIELDPVWLDRLLTEAKKVVQEYNAELQKSYTASDDEDYDIDLETGEIIERT